MAGQVLVDNTTGHVFHVSGCVSLFQVPLTSRTYRPSVGWFTCLRRFTIAVGESRYAVTVRASYSECSQGRPHHGLKPCLPAGRMPPLPPGTYYAKLFQTGDLVRVPPAPTVRVTAPMAGGLMGILPLHAISAKPATIIPQIKGVVLIVNAFIDVPTAARARKTAARDKVRDGDARTLAEAMKALAAVRTTPG